MYLLNYDVTQSNKQLLVMQGYVKTCCNHWFWNYHYFMPASQKDWKQPNPRIWLAKTEVDMLLMRPASWGVLYVANY